MMRSAISPRLATRTRFTAEDGNGEDKGRRHPLVPRSLRPGYAASRWRVPEERSRLLQRRSIVAGGAVVDTAARRRPRASRRWREALSSSVTLSASGRVGRGGRLTRTSRNGIQASAGAAALSVVGLRDRAAALGRHRGQGALHRQRGVDAHRRGHAEPVQGVGGVEIGADREDVEGSALSRLPYQTETASRSLPVSSTPPDGTRGQQVGAELDDVRRHRRRIGPRPGRSRRRPSPSPRP